MTFRDREDGGRRLAAKLESFALERPFVLGLARGGMPVAFEVARALRADLDVLVVRKLGAPGFPEYALGAIAEQGAAWVNPEALREMGLEEEDLDALLDREAAELARRVRAYRGGRPPPDLAGRTAVLVDDGVATGATARAAARAARALGAARVVLATPVVAASTAAELRSDFDDVVAVELPEAFFAVGFWYERFEQLTDADVRRYLARTGERTARTGDGVPADPDPTPAVSEQLVHIPCDGGRAALEGALFLPERARGLVLFAHGSGSTRRSPRNRYVAASLQRAGFATVLFDLLTSKEAIEDEVTGAFRFDVERLTRRVVDATRWAGADPRTRALRIGIFGASTGAAAALAAAALVPDLVAAIVSRGGRPDLVPVSTLRVVRAPTLLVVGGRDAAVLDMNRSVLGHLARAELSIVPGATHLFEEPGTLDAVVRLAARWFELHLPQLPAQHPGGAR